LKTIEALASRLGAAIESFTVICHPRTPAATPAPDGFFANTAK
jgi:hypothetical protein